MSARTPQAAVDAFIAPMQRAASSVTRAVLVRRPALGAERRSLRFRDQAVRLRGRFDLELSIRLEYEVEAERGRARYLARAAGYRYELARFDGPMLLAYHWHPIGVSPITSPHLHLGGAVGNPDLSKAHLPTGPVSLQDLLRFAIADLGIEPLRPDWREVLAAP